jgi:hypothetical protein
MNIAIAGRPEEVRMDAKEAGNARLFPLAGRTNGPRLQDRWRLFRNTRRSGVGLPIHEAFKHLGDLLQWADSPDQGQV